MLNGRAAAFCIAYDYQLKRLKFNSCKRLWPICLYISLCHYNQAYWTIYSRSRCRLSLVVSYEIELQVSFTLSPLNSIHASRARTLLCFLC
jgi:hypothetical protein